MITVISFFFLTTGSCCGVLYRFPFLLFEVFITPDVVFSAEKKLLRKYKLMSEQIYTLYINPKYSSFSLSYFSGSKKGSSSHMNRSASADSGSRTQWIPQGGASVMPSQPIAQDLLMPPMPPPNTRVQLEEVNRRLNAGDALSMQNKSKYVQYTYILEYLKNQII